MIKIAIIGGTGVYSPELFTDSTRISVETPYGSASMLKAYYKDKEIYFLERHGAGHTTPPHQVNYRANIWALKKLSIDRVIATAAVGSMNLQMPPGSFVILSDFLDFTKSRPNTFFENNKGVVHVDMTEPYCPEVREALIASCKKLNLSFSDHGVYACFEGPRFETKAEIKMFQALGADVVGMTNVPEVVLANEANLCYGTVAMITNFCTGISKYPLSHEEVVSKMQSMSDSIRSLILLAIDNMKPDRGCRCGSSVKQDIV